MAPICGMRSSSSPTRVGTSATSPARPVHRVAQDEVDRLHGSRGLLGEQPRHVRVVARRAALGAVVRRAHVPDRGADVDADEHQAERDQRAAERRCGKRRADAGRRHRLFLSLLRRRANQLGDGREELGALDRLGERARGAGADRVLLAAALAGAEMPGHGNQLCFGRLVASERQWLRRRTGPASTCRSRPTPAPRSRATQAALQSVALCTAYPAASSQSVIRSRMIRSSSMTRISRGFSLLSLKRPFHPMPIACNLHPAPPQVTGVTARGGA